VDTLDLKRTLFSVSDFLDWQRTGTLDLSPPFQRRSVWKPGAKSYLVDSVYRGLPVPLIFLRQRLDLETQQIVREVIDGQQRLRTLFAFIDHTVLSDWDEGQDSFTIRRDHNAQLAAKSFSKLPEEARSRILSYEFSTHVLPTRTEDREILMIFARLNSTGTMLNRQELRNAKFFGTFKTLMYDLAYEQLERWLKWQVMNEQKVARMDEVELTSDLAMSMIDGLTAKSQPKLDALYERYDDRFSSSSEFSRRFRNVMDQIEDLLGGKIRDTVFSSEVNFFTLFTLLYDRMYDLGSELNRRKANSVPSSLQGRLIKASTDLRAQNVPDHVLDAIRRASADIGRRRTRLEYLESVCFGGARN
jgi:hypothetical protein